MRGSNMDMDNIVSESLGTLFKQTRRSQQKSIEDAAAETCIHVNTLRALEADDYSAMRAEIFVRGFIKIYAAYLGMDPGEALAIYEKNVIRTTPDSHHHHEEEMDEEEEARPLLSNRTLLVGILLLLAVVFFLGKSLLNMSGDSSNEVSPPLTALKKQDTTPLPAEPAKVTSPPAVISTVPKKEPAPAAAVTAPVGKTAKKEPVAVSENKADKTALPPILYTVEARFVESTWMKIRIDNGPSRQYTYHPGETRVWKARKNMNLFIGNAGGIRVKINDQDMPPLGPSGEVARLSIPSGLKKLLEKKRDLEQNTATPPQPPAEPSREITVKADNAETAPPAEDLENQEPVEAAPENVPVPAEQISPEDSAPEAAATEMPEAAEEKIPAEDGGE